MKPSSIACILAATVVSVNAFGSGTSTVATLTLNLYDHDVSSASGLVARRSCRVEIFGGKQFYQLRLASQE